MKEVVQSLQKYSLTKDIRNTLRTINPLIRSNNDLSTILLRLYEEDIIGENEYLAIETKMMLKQFCLLLERKYKDLICGVYLHDENKNTLWNASTPNIPAGYNEYTNGMSTKLDIEDGDIVPVYVKDSLAVKDVERAEDITSLNHKRGLLENGLQSFCCSPLHYKGSMIGHTVAFSKSKRMFTMEEMALFLQYNKLIEEKLARIKDNLISTISLAK
jgi:uncharacterized membrane protein YfhO